MHFRGLSLLVDCFSGGLERGKQEREICKWFRAVYINVAVSNAADEVGLAAFTIQHKFFQVSYEFPQALIYHL